VVVYKDQDGLFTVQSLIKAGGDSRLLARYIACIVPNETKVLNITGEITGGSVAARATRDVMVVTGSHAGCRGVVGLNRLQS
jgi:hypothetical protein